MPNTKNYTWTRTIFTLYYNGLVLYLLKLKHFESKAALVRNVIHIAKYWVTQRKRFREQWAFVTELKYIILHQMATSLTITHNLRCTTDISYHIRFVNATIIKIMLHPFLIVFSLLSQLVRWGRNKATKHKGKQTKLSTTTESKEKRVLVLQTVLGCIKLVWSNMCFWQM